MSENKKNGNVSHAYIIASENVQIRENTAMELARMLLCRQGGEAACGVCPECKRVAAGVHPDLITIERLTDDKGKPKREIVVDQIRSMAADAWIRPQQAERKVYLIKDAGMMNQQAQNCALKTLEEPPSYAAFILCAGSAEELLSTVRSRCVVIRPAAEAVRVESPAAREYVSLAAGGDHFRLCRFFSGLEKMDSRELTDFLEASENLLADIICGRHSIRGLDCQKAAKLAETLKLAEEYLRRNVGVKHVIGLLCVRTI